MNSARHNLEDLAKHLSRAVLLFVIFMCARGNSFAMSLGLEGQNKGDTNTWVAGNLQNWQELDYIPCRVHWTASLSTSNFIRIDFPHMKGSIPGFQDLFSFSNSANVVFTSPPTLSAPPTSSTWSYSFTVNILDNSDAFVYFFARMAAGAHLNVGSSLQLSGYPSSMGNLQIHKPAPGPGTPNLMVLKTGPASGKPGDMITYTLGYTNKTTGFNPATGVQLMDVLPVEGIVNSTNLPAGGMLVGNTIFWDLPNLPLGVGGQISFQAQIAPGTGYSVSFTNTAEILSAEDDLDYSDNTSILVTTTVPCFPPVINNAPLSRTNCVGTTATFSVSASGTGLSYQWYKGSAVLVSQTNTSLVLSNLTVADDGLYSVVVSGSCGSASNSVTLTVPPLPAITCASNKNVEVGTGWTFDAPTANYSIVVLGTMTNTAGHCGNTFDATRTWRTTDTCSSTNKTGEQGTAWTFDAPTATDNSGSATITILSTVTNVAGHCGTTFDATRTWQATDACGNSSSCSQKVTIVDTTAPVITCTSTNKTVEQGTAWTFDAPTATDNSGSATITILSTVTNTIGHCGTTFDATRTWQATDACGNSSSCSQKVTIVDTTAPVITCSSTNKTVEQGAAWTFDAPTATDNSGSAVITILSTVTNTAGHCGTTFDATRTWQATDACGNSSSCSQKVTIVDTTAPVITCTSTNKTVELGTTWTFDAPTATDNSGNATITILSTVTNVAGHCGTTFDATRTWQATDACGNSSSCSQKVTIV